MKILPNLLIPFCALLLAVTPSPAAEEAAKPYQLRPVTIWSDGTRMAGDLYVPADLKEGEKRAAIVFCRGHRAGEEQWRALRHAVLSGKASSCWPSTIAVGAKAIASS